MAQEKNTAKHSHAGHRKRLRERFHSNGLASFQQHEILELLLSFVVARKDTNELAHRLINTFGSINNVMEAPYDVLKDVNGVGEVVASYLKCIPEFLDIYVKNAGSGKIVIQKLDEAKAMIEPLLTSLGHENLVVLMIASNDTYIGREVLSNGNSDYVGISSDKLISVIKKYNAKKVVLAHNHPSGINTPSIDDITFTKRVYMMLHAIDIELLDHMIYARGVAEPYSFNNNQEYNNFRMQCIATFKGLRSMNTAKGVDGDEF